MRCSKRLEAIAALVPEGSRLVDVGCDHAYLPSYLVQEGKIPSALATDVREGPLERAREHVEAFGYGDKISVRLSDGLLSVQPGEGDCLVLAGMGGPLMEKILTEGKTVWESFQVLIAQPQSDIEHFRRFLVHQGWRVYAEDMILEDGKFYPMMAARKGTQEERAQECPQEEGRYSLGEAFGPLLLKERHPCLRAFLEREERLCEVILKNLEKGEKEGSRARREEMKERLSLVEKALGMYEEEV